MTGEILCIIPGPTVELARRPLGVKWCFHCRKHLEHDLVVCDYDAASPFFGYYEPVPQVECSQCKGDYALFPGRVRVWDEADA